MNKKILWKDISKSFTSSRGRFFSILCLMILGSFALVGLKVTGPDMRKTGEHYFNKFNLADISIISDYGIDNNDEKVINSGKGINKVEYGYLKDVTIKDTKTGFRIFSKTNYVSKYEIKSGRLPENDNEIAINNKYSNEYKIGDTIEFTEKADITGKRVLKQHKFKVVGYVNSSEIISDVNLGQTTAGTGELKGYAVVNPSVFDSEVYMIARISFNDTKNIDPYSDEYTDLVQNHKDELKILLKDQPEKRLNSIKIQYGEKIDEGINKLEDAKKQVSDNKNKLDKEVLNAQTKINYGEKQINNATASIDSAENQLDGAKTQLNIGEATLNEKFNQLQTSKYKLDQAKEILNQSFVQLKSGGEAISEGRKKLEDGYKQVAENQEKILYAQSQINNSEKQLEEKKAYIQQKQKEYQAGVNELNVKKQEVTNAQAEIDKNQNKLNTNRKQLEDGKNKYEINIQTLEQEINKINETLNNSTLTAEEKAKLEQNVKEMEVKLTQTKEDYEKFIKNTYNSAIEQIEVEQNGLNEKKQGLQVAQKEIEKRKGNLSIAKNQLDTANEQITEGTYKIKITKEEIAKSIAQINQAKEKLAKNEQILKQKEAEYKVGLKRYNQGVTDYNTNQDKYYNGIEQWQKGADTLSKKSKEYEENLSKVDKAKKELENKQSALLKAKSELETQKSKGEEKLYDAKKEIKENEEKLKEAQNKLSNLKLPIYSINTRRETPGSEGYKIYDNVSKIIDSLANIFPIFLYFVAALVTFTTMTRFVDEERTNSGTLKALGYSDGDILKKFIIYGFVSSTLGAIIGIILGHILLPLIVYNAYYDGFTVPSIELHFHLWITLIALILAFISAVLPAYIVAMKELKERPASLLVPKPPTAGSKILLEHITPIWNRMSFTHKVTSRNIFRYKKRMFMTIFGVCGSVALLFTGFGVQNSISGINERQFGGVINYDLIVAHNNNLDKEEQKEIDNLLNLNSVKQQSPIFYEEVSKVAGKNKDKQSIKLIVPEKSNNFSKYINLANRKTEKQLNFQNDGAIISERLAKLLEAEKGDVITIKDENNNNRSIKVTDITEMYMGHFIFMNKETYEKVFNRPYSTNANLVTLKDRSEANTNKQASAFMELSGVKGVVQNTTLTTQINTIVNSLDKIMKVLIIIATLLAVVILYNLTNINVSERIRELSTIKVLGFFNNEVTMYIYRETLILSFFGIFAGYALGILLHSYIITSVPPDDVMFNPTLLTSNFIIPAIIIIIITLVLGMVVNSRLKNVDMMEALKSVE
ncbi:FtsX-like permease family protein [Clostridium sp. L74]|uniref:FtsX-like permease family protein n=1 Tax=Clostridium sp. L74 TaxID=1560217 RepID=UPI0006C4B538|nr:hypothetical protein ND00_19110 [Clostridium sp. L74]